MRFAEIVLLVLVFVGAPGWGTWRVARRRLLRRWEAEQDDTVARLTDRLSQMSTCVQVYVDSGGTVRDGWLEEEIAASDKLLNDLRRKGLDR